MNSNVNGIRNLLELSKNQYEKSSNFRPSLFLAADLLTLQDAIPTPETCE